MRKKFSTNPIVDDNIVSASEELTKALNEVKRNIIDVNLTGDQKMAVTKNTAGKKPAAKKSPPKAPSSAGKKTDSTDQPTKKGNGGDSTPLITISDLAKEARISPLVARRILRKAMGKPTNASRWKFSPDSPELESARKALNLIK